MAIFKCDICEQKDLRIVDKDKEIERLLAQISNLNKLVFPTQMQVLSKDSAEFDRILAGLDAIAVDPNEAI